MTDDIPLFRVRATAIPLVALLVVSLAGAAATAQTPEDDGRDPAPLPQGNPVATPLPPETFDRSTDYTIGRQDLLDIAVFGVESLDQTVRVAQDGSITMPLLGRIDVGGLTKSEVERLIAGLLAERYVQDPQVTVFIREYESKRVAVTGAVQNPGSYEMLGDKTLLEMISLAGGLGPDIGTQIVIFRPGPGGVAERLPIDLEQLVYAADPSMNVAIEAGDIIYVPIVERVRIFVTGAVQSPNLYEVPRSEPITVLKAITLAGGTTDRAAEKKVQIMRTDFNGQRIAVLVNLKKIKRGKAEDPLLQEDDIVLVPEAFF